MKTKDKARKIVEADYDARRICANLYSHMVGQPLTKEDKDALLKDLAALVRKVEELDTDKP